MFIAPYSPPNNHQRTKTMKALLVTTLILVSTLAQAERPEIIVGLYTAHLSEAAQDYNNDNRLIAVKYHTFIAGTFVNSYGDRTYMAGAVYERTPTLSGHEFIYGFTAGAMYGYCWDEVAIGKRYDLDDCEPTVTPYVKPFAGYRYDALSVRLLVGSVMMLTAGFEF